MRQSIQQDLRHFPWASPPVRRDRGRAFHGRWLSTLLLLGSVTLLGCGARPDESDAGQASSSSGKRAGKPLTSQVERGPVQLTVTVDPVPARLSDEPTLTLTINYATGVTVHKPPFGEAVGDFLIRDFRETLPEIHGDREIVRQIYTLEPARTGISQIDPIVVRFLDGRPGGTGREHEVSTEALSVEVLSVVHPAAPSLDALKGIEGPVPLPQEPSMAWWWGAGLLAIAAAAVGTLEWRRRARVPPVPPTPREVAEQELDQLWDSRLFSRDVKQFYVELTDIVRRYIEGTTGVRAPEQTTEEFLREIGAGEVYFSGDDRHRLAEFLRSADLVKFAAHRPGEQDAAEAFERARAFVGSERRELAA